MSNKITQFFKMRQQKKRCAHAPTERSAMEYNMNHNQRGLALIFYHENFLHSNGTLQTKKDCEDLKEALNKLDFDVATYFDYTLREIKSTLKAAAAKDHSQHDCIAIAILTHGEAGFLWAHDEMYELDTISNYFLANKCSTLAGKPKLFFIEASRGEMLDSGITIKRTETDGERMSYDIPIHADFLFFHSTIPDFYSWGNSLNGSWFIQSLVAELNKNGKIRDLLTLLTFVNRRVAMYQSEFPSDIEKDKQKQIPCITSMLTRILRFNDKNQQS